MDVEDQIFPGLLDGHKEILSAGYLRIDHKFEELFDQNTFKIVKKHKSYIHIFNSKNNYFERHHRLGKNRDKYFTVNKKNLFNV